MSWVGVSWVGKCFGFSLVFVYSHNAMMYCIHVHTCVYIMHDMTCVM